MSLTSQAAVQGGSVAATVVLARVLTPMEFGIVALVQSILGMVSLLGMVGVTAAIVTSRFDVEVKSATYYWLGGLVGGAAALLTCVLAPLVVRLMGQPGIGRYLQVLAIVVPISIMTLVPQALLQRRLSFVRMNLISLLGAMVYFGTEVVLALGGLGAWAVIIGQVSGAVTSLATAMCLARWVPRSRPRWSAIREDIGLLGNMGVGTAFSYFAKNLDYWAVSRFMGAGPLGIYYIAYVLPNIVRLRLSYVFRQVMLPVLAAMNDAEAQSRAWGRALRPVLVLGFPALVGIAAVAEPLVFIFFGDQWGAAIVPLQVVAVSSAADLLIQAVATVAIARNHFVFRTTALVGFRAILTGAGAFAAAWLTGSLIAVAWAALLATLITLLVQEAWLSRPLGIGAEVLGREVLMLLPIAAGMFVVVRAVLGRLPPDTAVTLQLCVGILVGVVVYASLGLVLAERAFREALQQGRLMLIGG